MNMRFGIFGIAAALLGLFSGSAPAEQSFQTGVTYVCNGERMVILFREPIEGGADSLRLRLNEGVWANFRPRL